MDESEENMSAEDTKVGEGSFSEKVKSKKRSLVERELETNLTARVTSPLTNGDGGSTSRYGRSRRLKTDPENCTEKDIKTIMSSANEKTPVKMQSPVYKMHASNSPIKAEPSKETPKRLISIDSNLDNQIESIYNENNLLSRFGSEEKRKQSPGNKFPKVYVRKDLIQKRDDPVEISNIFSPTKSSGKSTNSHLNNILERSADKYNLNTLESKTKSHNGYANMASVVKTLDFDNSKKKRKEANNKVLSKSDLFDLEARCEYQVGDLAWARMGTYPFWPCIVTREPTTGLFVKKKLFGRIEHDVINVTFFGDNGRRSWIMDSMLRKFLGQLEFETAREHFNTTEKKKDPRYYTAFFVSEKKMPQWSISVEEAEMLLREPKRLRIDILNDMLIKSRSLKTKQRSGKVRTTNDLTFSETLFDTLFSEEDVKAEDHERSKSRSRKSLDVSDVVTACLDNMAAKTGITKIQRQSHMDRWLQKAKSKTPEKSQSKVREKDRASSTKKQKKVVPKTEPFEKPYSLRKSSESRNLSSHLTDHGYNCSKQVIEVEDNTNDCVLSGSGIGIIAKVESLSESMHDKDVEISAHMDLTKENICESPTFTQNFDYIASDNNVEFGSTSADTETDSINHLNVDKSIELNSEILDTNKNSADLQQNCGHKEIVAFEHVNFMSTACQIVSLNEMSNDVIFNSTFDSESIEKGLTEKSDTEKKTASDNSVGKNECVMNTSIDLSVIESLSSSDRKDNNTHMSVDENLSQTMSTSNEFIGHIDIAIEVTKVDDNSNLSINSGRRLRVSSRKVLSSSVKPKLAPKKRSLRIKKRQTQVEIPTNPLEDPSFIKYMELRQDSIMEEHPELSQEEIVDYLLKTWQYQDNINNSSGTASNTNLDVTNEKVDRENDRNSLKSNNINSNQCESTETLTDIHLDVTAFSEEKHTKESYINKLENHIPMKDFHIPIEKSMKEAIKTWQNKTKTNKSKRLPKCKTVKIDNAGKKSENIKKHKMESHDQMITSSENDENYEMAIDELINSFEKSHNATTENSSKNNSFTKVKKHFKETKDGKNSEAFTAGTNASSSRPKRQKNVTDSRTDPDELNANPLTISCIKLDDVHHSVKTSQDVKVISLEKIEHFPRPKRKIYTKDVEKSKAELDITCVTVEDTLQANKDMELSEYGDQLAISSNKDVRSLRPKKYKNYKNIEKGIIESDAIKLPNSSVEVAYANSKKIYKDIKSSEEIEPLSSKKDITTSRPKRNKNIKRVEENNVKCNVVPISFYKYKKTISPQNEKVKEVQGVKETILNSIHDFNENTLQTDSQNTAEYVAKNTKLDESCEMAIKEVSIRIEKSIDDHKYATSNNTSQLQNQDTEENVQNDEVNDCLKMGIEASNNSIETAIDVPEPVASVTLSTAINEKTIGKVEVNDNLEMSFNDSFERRMHNFIPDSGKDHSTPKTENTKENVANNVKVYSSEIDEKGLNTSTEKCCYNVIQASGKITSPPGSIRIEKSIDNHKYATSNNTSQLENEDTKNDSQNAQVNDCLKMGIGEPNNSIERETSDEPKPVASETFLTAINEKTKENIDDNLEMSIDILNDSLERPMHNVIPDSGKEKDHSTPKTVNIEKKIANNAIIYNSEIDVNGLNESTEQYCNNVIQASRKITSPPGNKYNAENIKNNFKVNDSFEMAIKELNDTIEDSIDEPKNTYPEGENNEQNVAKNIKSNENYEIAIEELNDISKKNINDSTDENTEVKDSYEMAIKELNNSIEKSMSKSEEAWLSKKEEVRISKKKTQENYAIAIENLNVSIEKSMIDSIPDTMDLLKYIPYKEKKASTVKTVIETTDNCTEIFSQQSLTEEDDKSNGFDANLSCDTNSIKDIEKNSKSFNVEVFAKRSELSINCVDVTRTVKLIEENSENCEEKRNTVLTSSSKDLEEKIYVDELTSDISRPEMDKLRPPEFKVDNNSENNLEPENLKSDNLLQLKEKVDEVENETSVSYENLPEPVKINGYYNIEDSTPDFSDGEFNAETSSINSEDSEPLSVTRNKLRSKNIAKSKNPLDNPDFVNYMELRQDDLMDEHPELSHDELVQYLFKTWHYEEEAKSDLMKTDDIEQSGLVKGLSSNLRQKSIRNSYKNKKQRNKQKESDNLSITSDMSSSKLRNIVSSPIVLIEDCRRSFSKESSPDRRPTRDFDQISFSSNSSERSSRRKLRNKIRDAISAVESSIENKPSIQKEIKKELIASDSCEIKSDNLDNTTSNSKSKEDSSNKKYFDLFSPIQSKDKNVDGQYDREPEKKIKEENEAETASINSEDSEISISKRKQRKYGDKHATRPMDDPEFLKYLELRQDTLIDENPQLTQDEIVLYLYKTWLYEESVKSDLMKANDIEQTNLVKGLDDEIPTTKRYRKKVKIEKDSIEDEPILKEKPKRKTSQPFYNEELSDLENEIELFEIFKPKSKREVPKINDLTSNLEVNNEAEIIDVEAWNEVDEVELYFADLTKPKPNLFKGLLREKVCEICEGTGNLLKCKGCNNMFHTDCVKKVTEVVEVAVPTRGRKKKRKLGRKPKSLEDSGSHSDDKSHDVSGENNVSVEEIIDLDPIVVDAESFESVLAAKMSELIPNQVNYDSYSSDTCLHWNNVVAGKCDLIDVKIKPKIEPTDSDFKCNNCQKYDVPICFVCKEAVSKTNVQYRQRCQTAHCHQYYHLECLDHWPQTQFNAGENSKNCKNERFDEFMCPRHVCHTCVSDDPRGCKTRFSGDKLARCVRCPATYHSFTKCLPAGTKILTGSHIICPRHYEHNRPGKVPCHVNTGWCFICALGGSLICCEFCPTSFHAECLNIEPPEGGYMCEDCETGRLPLYGEMVWVKLGHYRWWPGIILHPSEIPENILAVKHSPGEFVVRFFGQYDHYWVNRGRVFPFQEGDSGRVSSQKSKIDADFTTAMEHAQRACGILKAAEPNEEEDTDIASSLLPPHYVKLKVNKPCGSLCGKRIDIEESSLTQCECNPDEEDPCGPYSQCLNRMLLTECGPICRAGDRCNNRAFEKRLYPKMVPYRTPQRGWGLRTLEDIKAGQFVIEYVGELIDLEEFRRRMNRKHEIRDENFYFLTLDKERMIDAGPKGNLARFMNHCCEPNCETQKWTVLGDVRVGLFAIYDIPANSELTFNYNLECAGIEKKRCMCGAKRCSGYIGAKPKQDESQIKKNKLLGKRTYKKRKQVEDSPSTKNKPKRPVGRPAKPRELTEIEKDLLIIKNATNSISSDSECSGRLSSIDSENVKALKRKRVSFSSEEVSLQNGYSPSAKKTKLDEDKAVGD